MNSKVLSKPCGVQEFFWDYSTLEEPKLIKAGEPRILYVDPKLEVEETKKVWATE